MSDKIKMPGGELVDIRYTLQATSMIAGKEYEISKHFDHIPTSEDNEMFWIGAVMAEKRTRKQVLADAAG